MNVLHLFDIDTCRCLNRHLLDFEVHIGNTQQELYLTTDSQFIVNPTSIADANFLIDLHSNFLACQIGVQTLLPHLVVKGATVHVVHEGEDALWDNGTHLNACTSIEREEVLPVEPTESNLIPGHVHVQTVLVLQVVQEFAALIVAVAFVHHVLDVARTKRVRLQGQAHRAKDRANVTMTWNLCRVHLQRVGDIL